MDWMSFVDQVSLMSLHDGEISMGFSRPNLDLNLMTDEDSQRTL